MTRALPSQSLHGLDLPLPPDWLARLPLARHEEALFAAGAVLALLHLVQGHPAVPQALWRARLALGAAAMSLRATGRAEREAALRDALCLLRPGDAPGPVGEIGLVWARAVARPVTPAHMQRLLPRLAAPQLAALRAPDKGPPLAQVARTIADALPAAPHDDLATRLLADAVLARAMGWEYLVPVLGTGLGPGLGRARALPQDLSLACAQAVVRAGVPALHLAADLARRAAYLRALAPRLRAKGAMQALDLVLSRDAIAPSMLVGELSDRAARRFCDRLVALGGLREMTGRAMFRLYGL